MSSLLVHVAAFSLSCALRIEHEQDMQIALCGVSRTLEKVTGVVRGSMHCCKVLSHTSKGVMIRLCLSLISDY